MPDLSQYFGGGAPAPTQPEQRANIVPEGWRHLTIERTEIITGRNGWAALKIGAQDRDTGLYVWDKITLAHDTSERAREIGRQRYGELMWCCGFDTPPSDTSAWEGQEFAGKIKHKPDDYRGGDAMEAVIVALKKADDLTQTGGEGGNGATFADDIPF
jgi:hypothetical protein